MAAERPKEIPALATLLGSNVKEWPYSEEALIYALRLRAQQEQTKRQYYQLENSNKSLEILKTAISAEIPPHLIPQLFYPTEIDPKQKHEETPIRQPQEKSMTHYKFPSSESASHKSRKDFEFRMHRRTESPARIGAEAVAALNNSMSIKEEDPNAQSSSIPSPPNSHRRMNSMPVFKNEPTTGVLNFTTWQVYNSQAQNNGGIKKPSSSFNRKHRRTKSTDSAFGVINLNAVNQISFKQSDSRHDTQQEESKKVLSANRAMPDNDETFSERSSNEVSMEQTKGDICTPVMSVKGPNFADNLLNS